MPLLLVAVAYAIGCISPGYLLVRRATGLDLRAAQTGSTGARNAGRMAGRRVGAAVFALDVGKGAVAVGLAALAGAGDTVEAACLLAVVAGHVLPVQLRLRGGRGLSPALGGLLVADRWPHSPPSSPARSSPWRRDSWSPPASPERRPAPPPPGCSSRAGRRRWSRSAAVLICAAHLRRPGDQLQG